MNKCTWKVCCSIAIKVLGEVSTFHIYNEKTIQNWNKEFCLNETFIAPFLKSIQEPKLFLFFPEAKNKVVQYCNQHIALGSLLRYESVATEIWKKLFQSVTKSYKKKLATIATNLPKLDELLTMMGLETFSISTTWRVLQYLGFKYSKIKKYYRDGHKQEDIVKDWNKWFLKIFSYKLQSMIWVQLKEEDTKRLEVEEKDFPKNCFYKFDNNGKFHKYHIDSHNVLENFVWPENKKYGGNKSIRWKGCLLMIICYWCWHQQAIQR